MAEWWESSPLAPDQPAPTAVAEDTSWWKNTPEASFSERLQGRQPGPLIPSRTSDQFNVLPMRKTGPPGQWEWDMSAGALGALQRALTSPGDIARGTVPTPYSPGASPQPSSDVLSRATETAGLLAGPSPSYVAGARYGAAPTQALPKPPTIAEIGAAADAATNRAAPGRAPVLTAAEREELLQTARGNNEAIATARNAKPEGGPLQSGLDWYGEKFASRDPLTAFLTNISPGLSYGVGGGGWKGIVANLALRGSGEAAKAIANAMAKGQTRLAEELARRNSPLGQGLLENLPLSPSRPPPVGRDQAIMQSLIPGLLGGPPPDRNRLPPGYI